MSQNNVEKWDDVHGADTPTDRMEAFVDSTNDAYAILQLKRIDETVYARFESYSSLQRQGKEPDADHYEVVYTAPLAPFRDRETMLEELYMKFNLDHPADFTGHSLSVSDIVALKVDGVVSCHYVDSIGFVELPGFFSGRNHLRTIEDAVEQNDNSFDGVINNMPEPENIDGRQDGKPSVLDQLKSASAAEPPRKAARKPAERDLE